MAELDDFLDQIALVSDVDALDGQGQKPREKGVVQLSTIHGAKGLEFDHVLVTGVEEGLLPHYYCSDSIEEVEVERGGDEAHHVVIQVSERGSRRCGSRHRGRAHSTLGLRRW